MKTPQRNIPLFIAFRALFNGRFYYPVFAILFLDYGLSMEHFADLNAIWALAIILLEVPSGVLADVVGRRRLVVAAAALMVVEMALLAFVPLGTLSLVFAVMVLNRIVSGGAEAMASGADEALAYDSLPEENREDRWAEVLERTMRWQFGAFVVAALLGAAVYDAAFVNATLQALGLDVTLEKETTIRFPIYLNLLTAIGALVVALMMTDLRTTEDRPEPGKLWPLVRQTTRTTLEAGRWILSTPFALCLILIGIFHDSIIRLFLTLQATYLRLIDLPEASFGLISTGVTLVGLVLPGLAKRLHRQWSPLANFALTWGCTLIGLAGLALVIPYAGVIFIVFLMAGMIFLNYFLSNYLNSIVEPARRATVLSFRGLAMNLAYGLATLTFGRLILLLEEQRREIAPNIDPADAALVDFFQWQPLYFVLGGLVLFLVVRGLMGAQFGIFLKPRRRSESAAQTPG